ncbi:MAG: ROK family protein [Gudongella sp.]|nr:ROK family protein [Gudongella sp.]
MKKVIGIDVGGTSISGSIVNERGEILMTRELETSKSGSSFHVINGIKDIIDSLYLKEEICGIGIGAPGFIDTNNGKILSVGGNIEGWAGTHLKDEINSYYNLPIKIENDANAATICEGWLGAGKDMKSFIMLTIGTGMGGGIYTKKQGLWRGEHFQAAEFGHSLLYPGGIQCICGQKGCSERYISGSAIENSFFEKTGQKLAGKEIFRIYNTDNNAKISIDDFAYNFGLFIVSLKNSFDPEGIVIGGGVINSKSYWWDNMIASYENSVNDPADLKIVPAEYLNNAGMIGAAKAVLDIL